MNRRLFVQAGVSSLLIPSAMIAALANAPGPDGPVWDYFYFDERFADARRLARALSGATEPTPVQADITGIWTGGLAQARFAAPLAIKGVTTESFYFCLKILLADQGRIEAQVNRIDQDLHLWTIRTDNHVRRLAI